MLRNNFHLLLQVPFTPKRWSEEGTGWSVVFRWSHRRSHSLHCSTYWHRCGVDNLSSLPSKVSWTSVVQIILRLNMEKANKLTLASDLLSDSDFIEVGCLCIFAKTIFFFSFLETKRIQTIRHTESRLAIYYDRQVKFLCISEKKKKKTLLDI